MLKPAKTKLRLMVRSAGTPICCIVSEALKIESSLSGISIKIATPMIMMHVA